MEKLFNSRVLSVVLLAITLSVLVCPKANAQKKGKRDKLELQQSAVKGDVGNTVSLVASGTGNTKEEATKNALRSALEQAYGTFVSSNTKVVNDELLKDEIVSISTGNIVSYEELSFIDSSPKQVTVKAVVSITRLQNYAQNKGMSAELAGNTFAMNLKMEELNKKNQDIALKHLLEQTQLMSSNLFDYKLSVGNPEETPKGVQVPVTIIIQANPNTIAYYELFHKTFSSLAIQKSNDFIGSYGGYDVMIDHQSRRTNTIVYRLRGTLRELEPHNTIYNLFELLESAILNCELVDNLGNVSGFSTEPPSGKEYSECVMGPVHRYKYYPTNRLHKEYYGGTGRSDGVRPHREGYKDIWDATDIPWLNSVKPKVGEKLYDTKLFLMYTVDEISKISKIEIRPKLSTLSDVVNYTNQLINKANSSQGEEKKELLKKADYYIELMESKMVGKTEYTELLNHLKRIGRQIKEQLNQ